MATNRNNKKRPATQDVILVEDAIPPPTKMPELVQRARFQDEINPEDEARFTKEAKSMQPDEQTVLQLITTSWNKFLKLSRQLLEEPETIINLDNSEFNRSFERLSYMTRHKPILTTLYDPYLLVANQLSAVFKCAPERIEIDILYRASHRHAEAEDVVRECMAKYCSRDELIYPPLWVELAFLKRCATFFTCKGKTRSAYCQGLIPFLKTYTKYYDDEACASWVQSIELFIQKHCLKDFTYQLVEERLRLSFRQPKPFCDEHPRLCTCRVSRYSVGAGKWLH